MISRRTVTCALRIDLQRHPQVRGVGISGQAMASSRLISTSSGVTLIASLAVCSGERVVLAVAREEGLAVAFNLI